MPVFRCDTGGVSRDEFIHARDLRRIEAPLGFVSKIRGCRVGGRDRRVIAQRPSALDRAAASHRNSTELLCADCMNAISVCQNGYPYRSRIPSPMANEQALSEYLVISRGRWDERKSSQEIQAAIDAFYAWHERLVVEGKAKPGQRLAQPTMMVSQHGVIDGPFAESKEVIGGYWFFLAGSLAEAAALAAQNPCLACGLSYEVRPIELERCSAFDETSETPQSKRARA